ncbi:MAG TPA: ribbon-helix-helix domain-containing protein [Leptolyngbya sp.]|jgi:antitoxin ParD1/3/4|nr:ribbon-helix-helix domain-containing protein [Leptolyngbya sp.]
MKVSVSLSDDLIAYIDRRVENRSQLIESVLQHWRKQQEQQTLVEAALALDGLDLGWNEEWEQAAITDWEASGL